MEFLMRALRRLALVLPGLLAVFLSGCGPSTVTERNGAENILLITVDALRADHLSAYGYGRETSPLIDAWFQDGAIFERAYSTETSTPPAMVSCLSGLLPYQHGLRMFFHLLDPSVELVSTRLSQAGYQTAAVVSNVVLTEEALGIKDRFDYYDDFVDEVERHRPIYERRASRTTDAAIRWLGTKREEGRPSFLWVHYIDPHGPYYPPAEASTDFTHEEPIPIDISRVPEYEREPDVTDGAEYVDRYDEEIAYADREIDRLLDAYAEMGLMDRGVVIFTADHGESMMEHQGWFRHGHAVYEEVSRIPLMMLGNAIPIRGRVATPVSNADVAPTILESAGLTPPTGLYGESLFRPRSDRTIFSEATTGMVPGVSERAAWVGTEKWVARVTRPANGADSDAPQPPEPGENNLARQGVSIETIVRYDLTDDPGELRPVAAGPDERGVRDLEALLDKDPFPVGPLDVRRTGELLGGPKVAPNLDDESLKKLRSLGYVQ